MQKQDFYFDLPKELIAQYPLKNRCDSRLLSYTRHTDTLQHLQFKDLADILAPGDLLVLNNSRVIPARFFGQKATGGRVEFLLERLQDDNTFIAHIKASKAMHQGMVVFLPEGWEVTILEKQEDLYHCALNGDPLLMLESIGHIPLPPYITREDENLDKERYQTVYAEDKGSVAAPTAGLHFDKELLKTLQDKGVNIAYTTLHVGAGTFRPMRVDNLQEHHMHYERCFVSEALVEAVLHTKAANKRVIAVGTTAMRSLESAAASGVLTTCDKHTNLFIRPGFTFQVCDGLLTNFHLPESTLLVLVSAFIGHQKAMALYQTAIEQQYRFFSYGDACLFL